MNGKGKEYKKEKLVFDGEYLNGRRWNGKYIYNKKEYLLSEGNYLNKDTYEKKQDMEKNIVIIK